jgi:integrase
MASIIKRPDGHRWIQFTDGDRTRKTLRLGKVSEKNAAKVCARVEQLLGCKISGDPYDRDLALWLADPDRGAALRDKLAAVGLVDAVKQSRLAEFLDEYITSRKDLKSATVTVLNHTRRCLVEFFGADKRVRDITAGDAEAWRVWLTTSANTRDKARDALASNTVNRRCGIAKQFFRVAERRGMVETNPFTSLSAHVRGNRARQYFVSRAEIDAAMEAAPDLEWRLIIALSRYAGLRIPSELLTLRWSDVDLPAGRMTIHASKTEHHEGGGMRICPIFPELKPYLDAAWDVMPENAEFVINRYRLPNTNLRTQFQKILKRAGVKPWPKLFHNMRASRQTELLDRFPLKAVCDWLGNSAPVAIEHYAQVTAEHFHAAITEKTGTDPALTGEARAEAFAKQNPKVQRSAFTSESPQETKKALEKPGLMRCPAVLFNTPQNAGMGVAGLEPATPTV